MSARNIIGIVSGKGGVGKSTVSLNLSLALAERGHAVGLLDADLYGPDIALMVGLTRQHPAKHVDVWRNPLLAEMPTKPIERYGIKVMSSQFLVAEDQALAMSDSVMRLLLHRLVEQLDWGTLDYLVIDLPPGTADLQQLVARHAGLSGVIVVVTPQDLAHLDAKKAITMYTTNNVAVLGGIENMSGMACPDCRHHIDVFPRVPFERSIWATGIERLALVPMVPALAAAAEAGQPTLLAHPDGEPAQAFRGLADVVVRRLP